MHGKELNKLCPPDSSDDLYIFFCLYPSSMSRTNANKKLDLLGLPGLIFLPFFVYVYSSTFNETMQLNCYIILLLVRKHLNVLPSFIRQVQYFASKYGSLRSNKNKIFVFSRNKFCFSKCTVQCEYSTCTVKNSLPE